MKTFEFKADIENGVIELPEPYKTELGQRENVRVIISYSSQAPVENILLNFLDNPVILKTFTPLSREEIYDR